MGLCPYQIPGFSERASVVRYLREKDDEDSRVRPAESLTDAWLLNRFPGRFLEEIDATIDYGRHLRAWEAERIESIEERRMADLSLTNLTEQEKAAIVANDQILRDVYG